tara:strand:+ start:236 stop:490 length:255 start_codon:yes stop_codon:yes gene_type:complete
MKSEFPVVELSFEPIEFTPTLEDEFEWASISKEIEANDNIKELKAGALNLLKVANHRKAVIRGLCKRLAQIETYGTVKKRTQKN